MRLIDETGKRYGRLLVLERVENGKHGHAKWLCHCDCGNEIVVFGNNLCNGNTKSCGCYTKKFISERNSLPEGEAAFNVLLGRMQGHAEQRDLEWQLTKEQIAHLTKQPCHYCGAEPSQILSTVNDTGVYVYNGLDRVDNGKGYILTNVVPCCKTCNYSKRSMTVVEFEAWIVKVYTHLALSERNGYKQEVLMDERE